MGSFVHLNVHSTWSMLEGVATVEQLVDAAVAAEMPAVALTDTDGLYGVVPFARACRARGVKPIFGVELTDGPARGNSLGKRRYATLLARDRPGYQAICEIVTRRHLERGFRWEDSVSRLPPSVFVLTGDEAVLRRRAADARLREACRVAIPCGMGAAGIRRRDYLLEVAAGLHLRPVAVCGVRFITPDARPVHKLLAALRHDCTVGTLPEGAAAPETAYFMMPEEVAGYFPGSPDCLSGTLELARECDVELDLSRRKLPRFPVPGGGDANRYLRGLALKGLSERYSESATDAARGMLERELAVIARMGLADYFLICHDIVNFARSRGIPCLGRGSAANSIVSFTLHITHVDPLAHNLFFERFLNEERTSLPDFDLDFGTRDREAVLDYIFRRYRKDHVAMIGTFATFRVRGAFREVAHALGIPQSEIDAVVRRLPHFCTPDRLEEKLATAPDTCDLPLQREPFATVRRFAERIGGFPRHIATHPCGLVITDEPITWYMPLQRGDKGLPVTQWSMYPVEEAGLLKIDILGQKGLEVISRTAEAARRQGIAVPDNPTDCLRDARTRRWMREGRTVGCFYIESPGMISLIRQARCDDFECLTALSSIIRPGVSSYGGKHTYLRRHLRLEPETVLHPILKPILRDTRGCLIYQEQLIRIAAEVAGLNYAEADDLRRLMSFKKNRKRLSDYRDRFFEGCREKGMPDAVIRELYRQVESFAGYAFCKAHSASFALESFESMYYKSHFPAEFMAAALTAGGGYYQPAEYLEEARRLGVVIHPPCINGSDFEFTGAGGHLRVGLMQVKGLSEKTIARLLDMRAREGAFTSLPDFLRRVTPSVNECRNLALCGAMRSLGRTLPEILWGIEIFYNRTGLPTGREQLHERIRLWESVPPIPDPPYPELLAWELKILGMTPSGHPFRMFPDEIRSARRLRPIIRSVDLQARAGHETYLLGWKVASKKTRVKRSEEMMAFITFSDEWGRFEAAFFPASYTRNVQELHKGDGPFLLKGTVESEFGVPSLVTEHARFLGGGFRKTAGAPVTPPPSGARRSHHRTDSHGYPEPVMPPGA